MTYALFLKNVVAARFNGGEIIIVSNFLKACYNRRLPRRLRLLAMTKLVTHNEQREKSLPYKTEPYKTVYIKREGLLARGFFLPPRNYKPT
jgi:hypothetical protein